MRRLAWTMTIDPDGAMHDWVDLPDGWELIRIPSQEAVHLAGARALQDLYVDVCAREAPDFLVTHPPYDWIDEPTADRIRATGTRLVAYAFDDEIFAESYDKNTRDAIARAYDRYATTREVRWATAPLPPLPSRDPEFDVALVGRAYARRRALVEELRKAGLRVATRGDGWPDGFVSRAGLLDLYSRAAIVLTTADWEQRAVPMVKHRLVETAMLGAFQIAQAAPDLRGYFSDEEVPSFAGAEELVAKAKQALADPERRLRSAAAARARSLAEHTWRARLPDLVDGSSFAARSPSGNSIALDQLLSSLASRAEASGRTGAAIALYQERLRRDPDQPAALAGLGRCLRDVGELERAIEILRRAANANMPIAARSIHARLPSFGVGTGLGRMGLLPPDAEPIALLVATLCELDRADEAAALLDGIDRPALRHALAATLTLGDSAPPAVAAALGRLCGL